MPTDIVHKLSFLTGLDQADAEYVQSLMGSVFTVKLERGRSEVFNIDRRNFHILLDGWACRVRTTENGDRQVLGLLLPGDICELDITQPGSSGHTVEAITNIRVVAVSFDRVGDMLSRPAIALAVLKSCIESERRMQGLLVSLGVRSALERLAYLLCELESRLFDLGMSINGCFDFPLRQDLLSEVVGLTSVHTNRMLRILRDRGLVTVQRRRLVIQDLPLLRSLGGFNEGDTTD